LYDLTGATIPHRVYGTSLDGPCADPTADVAPAAAFRGARWATDGVDSDPLVPLMLPKCDFCGEEKLVSH
jgi:hypothetical protein